MKNGTSQAILVGELLVGDGPFGLIADDFVAQRCSLCSAEVNDDMRFVEHGYCCRPCGALSGG